MKKGYLKTSYIKLFTFFDIIEEITNYCRVDIRDGKISAVCKTADNTSMVEVTLSECDSFSCPSQKGMLFLAASPHRKFLKALWDSGIVCDPEEPAIFSWKTFEPGVINTHIDMQYGKHCCQFDGLQEGEVPRVPCWPTLNFTSSFSTTCIDFHNAVKMADHFSDECAIESIARHPRILKAPVDPIGDNAIYYANLADFADGGKGADAMAVYSIGSLASFAKPLKAGGDSPLSVSLSTDQPIKLSCPSILPGLSAEFLLAPRIVRDD